LISVCCFLTDNSIALSCILDTISIKIWCFLVLDPRDILLKEISGNNIPCDSSTGLLNILFVHISSCSIYLCIVFDGWLNNIIIIVEVEMRHKVIIWIVVSMISNNSLSNQSIIFWIFFIQHNEKKIKS